MASGERNGTGDYRNPRPAIKCEMNRPIAGVSGRQGSLGRILPVVGLDRR